MTRLTWNRPHIPMPCHGTGHASLPGAAPGAPWPSRPAWIREKPQPLRELSMCPACINVFTRSKGTTTIEPATYPVKADTARSVPEMSRRAALMDHRPRAGFKLKLG